MQWSVIIEKDKQTQALLQAVCRKEFCNKVGKWAVDGYGCAWLIHTWKGKFMELLPLLQQLWDDAAHTARWSSLCSMIPFPTGSSGSGNYHGPSFGNL